MDKVRKVGEYHIQNDGVQWIVQKEFKGKDKKGNEKISLSPKSYFGRFDSMCKHIGNLEMMKCWNSEVSDINSVFCMMGFTNEQ